MNKETRVELLKYTNELLRLNEEAKSFYTNIARKEGYEPDFFGIVKPFAEKVTDIREKWLNIAKVFIQQFKPLHLHPVQLQQTVDNLEVIAIKSFYGKSSLKIQMETFKAVDFTLKQLVQAIEDTN